MGVSIPKLSRSVYDAPVVESNLSAQGISQISWGNPDPTNYRLDGIHYIGDFLILEVTYPDAKNYEGRKILVYDGDLRITDLTTQPGGIDPHFSYVTEAHHPIARFEPTPKGLRNAIAFCTVAE